MPNYTLKVVRYVDIYCNTSAVLMAPRLSLSLFRTQVFMWCILVVLRLCRPTLKYLCRSSRPPPCDSLLSCQNIKRFGFEKMNQLIRKEQTGYRPLSDIVRVP